MVTLPRLRRSLAIVGAALMVLAAVGAGAQTTDAPGMPLAGIVRDPEGRPVVGATVVAGQFGGGRPNHRIARTGPDGRFELTPGGDTSRLEFVVAYKEGFAPASAWHMVGDQRDGADDLRLSRPEPFVGLVKDREGRPVAGASVRIRHVWYPGDGGKRRLLNAVDLITRGTALEPLLRTETDAGGAFRFAVLPRGARASLIVTAPGMGEYSSSNRRRPDGQDGEEGSPESPAEIVMAPAARVVGRVVSKFRSAEIGGLKVGMQGSGKSQGIWREAQTDAEGRFAFDGLDEGTANIFLTDQPVDGPWTYRAAADTRLEPGRTTEVRIELIRGVQVEGQVIDPQTRHPVAEVRVGLYGPIRPRNGAAIISASTDQDGRYRFRLPPGYTYFYICGPPPCARGRDFVGARSLVIPPDAHDLLVPPIELNEVTRGR